MVIIHLFLLMYYKTKSSIMLVLRTCFITIYKVHSTATDNPRPCPLWTTNLQSNYEQQKCLEYPILMRPSIVHYNIDWVSCSSQSTLAELQPDQNWDGGAKLNNLNQWKWFKLCFYNEQKWEYDSDRHKNCREVSFS